MIGSKVKIYAPRTIFLCRIPVSLEIAADLREIGGKNHVPGAQITFSKDINKTYATPAPPRARGQVALTVKSTAAGTTIHNLRQSGSLKCLFPRHGGQGLEAVALNTAGGITGGDTFSLQARTEPQTILTLTTQAAERAYAAQKNEVGRIGNQLHVSRNSRINWLPQETILYNNSNLSRSMEIELEPDARLLYCEPLIFGRHAMSEHLSNACFQDRLGIKQGGSPLFLDTIKLTGDIHTQLNRPDMARGASALASVVYIAPDADRHLRPLREILPDTAGVSLIRSGILALRLLAKDGYSLRQTLIPVLNRLYQRDLPRCWMT